MIGKAAAEAYLVQAPLSNQTLISLGKLVQRLLKAGEFVLQRFQLYLSETRQHIRPSIGIQLWRFTVSRDAWSSEASFAFSTSLECLLLKYLASTAGMVKLDR